MEAAQLNAHLLQLKGTLLGISVQVHVIGINVQLRSCVTAPSVERVFIGGLSKAVFEPRPPISSERLTL